jgi:hypothetical protein
VQSAVIVKIGSIVIHCHGFARMVEFWQEALQYVPRAPAKDGWVVLRDPQNRGPNLSFQARESRPPHRSWMHLDLYSPVQDEEVVRVLALGARPTHGDTAPTRTLSFWKIRMATSSASFNIPEIRFSSSHRLCGPEA